MAPGAHVDYDVIIVGSGPAGTACAFPLVEAGLNVLMVDPGYTSATPPPRGDFLVNRIGQVDQWKWMIGSDYHAVRALAPMSPKLRVPQHAEIFKDFEEANRIITNNFLPIGSLAVGGLSNSWGGGVGLYSADELAIFPVPLSEMMHSYQTVTKRMGVSGGFPDDLSDFFGLDQWSMAPIPLDRLQTHVLKHYEKRRHHILKKGLRIGRSRVAVLSEPAGGRDPCNRCGQCLWGCARQSIYKSTFDIDKLIRFPNFTYRPGIFVARVLSHGGVVKVWGRDRNNHLQFIANKVVLAAGTLATTRLAFDTIGHKKRVPMFSSPTAAFLLWLPRFAGRLEESAFGMGQLSFSLALNKGVDCFGSFFNSTRVPISEYVRRIGFGRRYAIDFLRPLLSSCIVGNLFLPGNLSDSDVELVGEGQLAIRGGYRPEVGNYMDDARRKIRGCMASMGAYMLPFGFTVGQPGADIHYAGSLPMKRDPRQGQSFPNGEIVGAPGVHIADGACLPCLPAKSHTLTVMANADRIGICLVNSLSNQHSKKIV